MLRVLHISAEPTNFLHMVVPDDDSPAHSIVGRVSNVLSCSRSLYTPAESEEKVIFGFAESVSLARLHGSFGARAYNLVEARLLLRAGVLAIKFIFHYLWQACVQLSRARILDGTLGQPGPFMNCDAYQTVLAG